MNPLKEAVLLLSKEEVRAFKLSAQKVKVKGERLDLLLFDSVRQMGDDYDEDALFKELYPKKGSKNAFHRLKSRLLLDINKSMVGLYDEKNETLRLYHFLSVIEFYIQKRHFGLAHWFLRKAERLAKKLDHLEGLDIVYNQYIRLSHQVLEIDPTVFIRLRQENQDKLRRLRQLDNVLAAVTYRLGISQTKGVEQSDLIQLLRQTVDEFADEKEALKEPSFRTKMFQAVSKLMLNSRDFASLARFSIDTYEEFLRDKIFGQHNHDLKLQMLTYIVNALNLTGEFNQSLNYAERLKESMEQFNRLLYKKYLFFYYNSIVINNFQLNLEKAIEILEKMLEDNLLSGTPFYRLFTYMNLALAWNQKENYRKSIRYIVQSYMLDGYKTAAPGLQLKISTAELIVRYELKEFDVLDSRIPQVEREFKELLSQEEGKREKSLIKLVSGMKNAAVPHEEKNLLRKAKNFLKRHGEQGDEQIHDDLIGYTEFIRKHFQLPKPS